MWLNKFQSILDILLQILILMSTYRNSNLNNFSPLMIEICC